MNGFEQLLHWTAERGSGTLADFESAHAWATGEEVPALRTLRVMSALGHLEVDWPGARWGAVRPTVTLLPDAAGYGLVVGARTARLTTSLNSLEEPDIFVDLRTQHAAPDACFVASDSEQALERLASQFELPFAHSVAGRLADVLPPLDAMLRPYLEPPMAIYYGVERFDLDENFVRVDGDTDPGLYLYDVAGPRRMQFADDDGARYKVDLAVGTWAEARRLGAADLLYWQPDGTNGTLFAPWMLPLPVLHARASALCSGLRPGWNDHGDIIYVNVPEWLAVRIAESLEQELGRISTQ
ncbi:MAG TPA: hypothetical protein VGO29_12580 [Solirubrobacteraceae bacterium]|jgi:hypothetical protein|nr:hypothetical protein [Solirubrobacteraceae bacterium]